MSNGPNFANKDKLVKDAEIESPEFDITFQCGLLRLALKDDYFCSQLVRYLAGDKDLKEFTVFDSSELYFIFDVIAKSFEQFKTRPSEAQLRTAIMEFAEDEREPYFKALDNVKNVDIHNDEFYRKYIASYVMQVKMAAGIKKGRVMFRENPSEAPAYFQKVVDSIHRVQFEKEDVIYLNQVFDLVKKENDVATKIPTGLTKLDEDMRGGFPRETLVTVLAGSNAGKSIFCTSLGCNALRTGFKVLHINLEGTRDEVIFRYVSNLADVPFEKIEGNSLTMLQRAKVEEVGKKFTEHLKVRNMLNFGITIEEVIAYCRECYKEFPFDMVVVDYGQLLKTKGGGEKFERQTDVYRGLDSISKEFRCVVISPAQSTREGMRRQNEYGRNKGFGGGKGNEPEKLPVLRSDDLADCIEIARVSAVILTLNRTEEEEHRGWVRVFLEKQRRGRKAITYGIKANYPNSNLIINDYYEPNSLVHKISSDTPEEQEEKDKKEITLKKAIEEKKQVFKQIISLEEVAEVDNVDENLYNRNLLEYLNLKEEKASLDKVFNGVQDQSEAEKIGKRLIVIRDRRRQIEKAAKELLLKFMPAASETLFKEILKTIQDKKNQGISGTAMEEAKTELLIKQLELVFEKK